jgi:hypothetical protein
MRWLLLLLALAVWAGQVGAQGAVRFLAIGDVPYSESEHLLLDTLLAQELPRGTPFLVHVGDIKAGSSPCTDAALGRIAERFRALPVPVVYTPGDNEWTDCRREAAGGYDPRERLAFLRRVFYGDPAVLRLDALGATRPQPDVPEDYWFLDEGVLFATVHLVGSNDNLLSRNPASAAEHEARTRANRRHLERVAAALEATGAKALVLLFHANAGLERDTPLLAYRPFRESLHQLLARFPGPVLAIHGDTHSYQFDQPLKDLRTGAPIPRFHRLEVPGSPIVGGVWVTVDPASEEPFRVEPVYPVALDALPAD